MFFTSKKKITSMAVPINFIGTKIEEHLGQVYDKMSKTVTTTRARDSKTYKEEQVTNLSLLPTEPHAIEIGSSSYRWILNASRGY